MKTKLWLARSRPSKSRDIRMTRKSCHFEQPLTNVLGPRISVLPGRMSQRCCQRVETRRLSLLRCPLQQEGKGYVILGPLTPYSHITLWRINSLSTGNRRSVRCLTTLNRFSNSDPSKIVESERQTSWYGIHNALHKTSNFI